MFKTPEPKENSISKEYKTEFTEETKIVDVYIFLPAFRNGKFIWFKGIKALKRKYKVSTLEFDDGWSYQHYWKTSYEWKTEKYII